MKSFPAQVDIRLVSEAEYGAAFLYFTGSKEHNLQLRAWPKPVGGSSMNMGCLRPQRSARWPENRNRDLSPVWARLHPS